MNGFFTQTQPLSTDKRTDYAITTQSSIEANMTVRTKVAYLDLPIHGDCKQGDKVHDQNGPEDGHVEQLEEGADRADDRTLGHRVPELELGQAAHERLEFATLGPAPVCWQLGALLIVQVQFRIDLGREEGNEQVQVVDAQRVGDNVPALLREHPQQEQENQDDGRAPSQSRVRCQSVQLALVYLQGVSD